MTENGRDSEFLEVKEVSALDQTPEDGAGGDKQPLCIRLWHGCGHSGRGCGQTCLRRWHRAIRPQMASQKSGFDFLAISGKPSTPVWLDTWEGIAVSEIRGAASHEPQQQDGGSQGPGREASSCILSLHCPLLVVLSILVVNT